MNQAAAAADRGYVFFSVTSLSGTEVASAKVDTPVSGEPARYRFSWDNSASANGVYILQAVAVAGFGSRAQGMPVSIALNYENLAPPPPTSLTALTGDQNVTLNWVPRPRATSLLRSVALHDGVTFTKRADVDVPGTSYSETGLVNGTTYYYKVRVVNDLAMVEPFTAALPGYRASLRTSSPRRPDSAHSCRGRGAAHRYA